MINMEELEDVQPEKEEGFVLSNDDLINNKHNNDNNTSSYEKEIDNNSKSNNVNNFLNVDMNKDMLFLYGQNEKIAEDNFLEKLLEKEKYTNKAVSKDIDVLIQSYKYMNEHPDNFIEHFYKKNEQKTSSSNNNKEEEFIDTNENNNLNYIFNDKNSINEFNYNINNKEHYYDNIAADEENIPTDFNDFSNTTVALKTWSLKLGLIKEKHMHLNDQELINHFLKSEKFKRALKFYNVNRKYVTIPLIYKITKLLYFERPFPSKEKYYKLNMN
ncbi:conserved Plasmodium protein, unknown function, partial [Plasmodium sp. gorilla clade G3]